MTTTCEKMLTLLDLMAQTVQEGKKVEQGFVVCGMPDGTVVPGSRCGGDDDPLSDAHRCATTPPYCPEGGKPIASFHTHPVTPNRTATGEAAKALLIPSSMDLRADRELEVELGCIGGPLNDGRGFVWCFPRRGDIEVTVGGIWEMAKRQEVSLLADLTHFYERVGCPCMEAYFPLEEECPSC